MNRFKLRFRHRKLLGLIAVVLGLTLTPLLQSASAAEQVRLDLNYFSRVQSGPNATADPTSPTTVQGGSLVQFGVTVHNVEDANSDKVAKNFRIRISVPKATGTSLTSTAQVVADNGSSPAPYRGTDQVTLNSGNGGVFNLSDIGQVQLQRNNVSPTNTPTFNWGQLENVEQSQITTAHTAENFVFEIKPNQNGDLGPCFQNALRVFFTAKVQQAPHVTIEKKVRNQGVNTFVKENTAKPGEQLEYSIEVTNRGFAPATDLIVRDVLPPATSAKYVPGSCLFRSSSDQTLRPCPGGDNFKDSGIKFSSFGKGAWVRYFILVKVNDAASFAGRTNPFFINAAEVVSKETPIIHDTAKTVVVLASPTPPVTTTPTPTPPSKTTPPGPPTSGALPKTGGISIAMLSLIVLGGSLYLYARERRALAKVIKQSRLK